MIGNRKPNTGGIVEVEPPKEQELFDNSVDYEKLTLARNLIDSVIGELQNGRDAALAMNYVALRTAAQMISDVSNTAHAALYKECRKEKQDK